MILSFPSLKHSITLTSLESCCLVDWVAEKICDVWLPVVSNLPQIPIPLMNTFFPFFPALLRLMSLRSALGNNTAFGAYEHVFPVFPGAYKAYKRASEAHKRAHRRASETHKRASEIHKRACQQHA